MSAIGHLSWPCFDFEGRLNNTFTPDTLQQDTNTFSCADLETKVRVCFLKKEKELVGAATPHKCLKPAETDFF